MKKNLARAIGDIDERFIREADEYRTWTIDWRRILIPALCVLLVTVSIIHFRHRAVSDFSLDDYYICKAEIPSYRAPRQEDYLKHEQYTQEARKYYNFYWEYRRTVMSYSAILNDFTGRMIAIMTDMNEPGENLVYSPVSLFIALSMLADGAEGVTRKELLDFIGISSLEELETLNRALMIFNNREGTKTVREANSLWLDRKLNYNREVLENISRNFGTDSFHGTMGSAQYNKAFHSWLNERTGNILKEEVQSLKFTDKTLFAIASTMFFQDKWITEFDRNNTYKAVFHALNGEENVDMMYNRFPVGVYYDRAEFTALQLDMGDGVTILLALPKEGYSAEEVMANNDFHYVAANLAEIYDWEQMEENRCIIDLHLPRFDISSTYHFDGEEFREMQLKSLGADPDFSGLLKDTVKEVIIDHSCRLKADEEGITAAAFTVEQGLGAVMPEQIKEMIFDRPFIFDIRDEAGISLFAGIVNHP